MMLIGAGKAYGAIIARLERLEKRKEEAAQQPKDRPPPLPWDGIADGTAASVEQWQWLFVRSDIIDCPTLPPVNGLRELPPDGGQRP
jgi:hypothetical protein